MDLPRHQELFSEPEISRHYGWLGGVPENLTRPQRRYDAGEEGRRRENHFTRGSFWDDILMGVTAEEWWAKHGPPRLPGLGTAR